MKPEIATYIGTRFDRWMDYAKYHSDKAGITDDANDLLNEVLLNTLQKDSELLDKLYSAKKGPYRELDYFVLRMIKVNAHSKTSPFRWKYRSRNIATGVKLERLKIVDELPADEVDKSEILLKQFRLIAWVLNGLDLTESERRVFEHKFLHGNGLCNDWSYGPESMKQRYRIYLEVESVIHHILYYFGFTGIVPKGKLNGRQSELADQFMRTHKIHKQQK